VHSLSFSGHRRVVTGEVSVVVFDVNETLSDMAPMAQRFADVGADGLFAQLWFANLLRDGFALAAAGAKEKFGVLTPCRCILTSWPACTPSRRPGSVWSP
jgi:hypothetical protein